MKNKYASAIALLIATALHANAQNGITFSPTGWGYNSGTGVYSSTFTFDDGTTGDVSISPNISVSNLLASTPTSSTPSYLSSLGSTGNSTLDSLMGYTTTALNFKTNGSEIDAWDVSFTNFSQAKELVLVMSDVDGQLRDDGNQILQEQWSLDGQFTYSGTFDTNTTPGEPDPVWNSVANTLTGDSGNYSGQISAFESTGAVTSFNMTVTDFTSGVDPWDGASTRGATLTIFDVVPSPIPEPSSALLCALSLAALCIGSRKR